MQHNEIIDIMHGREVIYASVSDLFLYMIEDKHIKMLYEILPSFKEISSENNDVNAVLGNLEKFILKYIQGSNSEKESIIQELHRVYTRLFCMGKCVPISESVYLSPLHLTKQEAEIDVEEIYKLYGFNMNHTSNEPLDHLSYELMFMSYLAKGCAYHLSNNNIGMAEKLKALQKSFLQNHLLKWIEDFSRSIKQYEELDKFYYLLSAFLVDFLKTDEKYLETLEF